MMADNETKQEELTNDDKYYQKLRDFEPQPGWVGGYMRLTNEMVIQAIEQVYSVSIVGVSKSKTLAMSAYSENGSNG